MFECFSRKGKKKECIEKNVQKKKKHNIDTKRKKIRSKTKKKKNITTSKAIDAYAIPAITYQYVIRHKMTQKMLNDTMRWRWNK